jgi:hypothetical protein
MLRICLDEEAICSLVEGECEFEDADFAVV